MKTTLKELQKNNGGYFLGGAGIDKNDLAIVNKIICAIESSRTKDVQTLDTIDYTDKYGNHYHCAMAEFNTYGDGKFCIVQYASTNISIDANGKVWHSTSGGSFDGDKDISKFVYVGKKLARFWTFSSYGAGASHGLYFTAEVSQFIYNDSEL